MQEPINFGLIGAGGIGAYHLAVIESYERLGRVRLVAVADPTIGRFDGLRARLTERGVQWHEDYREMLRKQSELHAVTIATPIHFHLEMTRACLDRGLFVNLEKPPVPLIQQLEGLIAADRKCRVNVGFQMVTSRGVQMLKSEIVDGKLGIVEDIHVCGSWPRMDGYYNRASWAGKMAVNGEPVFDGPATNALAHVIQNIMHLAAQGSEGADAPCEVQGELYRARPIESYDVACLRGRFRSGIRFSAALVHAVEQKMEFRIQVRGTKGIASLQNDGALFESGSKTCECPEDTQELIHKYYGRFLDFVAGTAPRAITRLADTRGYVLATNGTLVSSGGIHTISDQCFRRYQCDNEWGYDVAGLREAVGHTFATGKLFSEQDLPWAVKSNVVALENFTSIDFGRFANAAV